MVFFIVSATMLFSGCFEIIPDFPDAPSIVSSNIRVTPAPALLGDSVIISFRFEDGNGDIGSSDNNAPNDFFATAYKRFNGAVVPVQFSVPSPPYNGKLPVLKNDGRPGPIEGEIFYGLAITPPLITPVSRRFDILPGDTISFWFRVRDQAGNFSDSVRTDEVRVLVR